MALQPELRENAMNPNNILRLLLPADLERILGVSTLEGYVPFVTLRVARGEQGLSFRIVKPFPLKVDLKVDGHLTRSLEGLEMGQWFDITIDAEGEIRFTVNGVEHTTNLLQFPMLQTVNNAFYADLATLAGKLRSFLRWGLPDTGKVRVDLETAITRNLEDAFPGTIAAVVGAKTVRVLTLNSLIEAAVSVRNTEGVCILELNGQSLERLGSEEPEVAVLRFSHQERPEFIDLGAAIIKAAAETMLTEANVVALRTFLAKLAIWKEAAANRLAVLAPEGESDYTEPGKQYLPGRAAEAAQYPDIPAFQLPDEN
jgi:hypothetical protein